MKKSIILVLLVLMVISCQKTTDKELAFQGETNGIENTEHFKSDGICEVNLIAAQNILIGIVSSVFNNEGDQLTITFSITNDNWCILETHVDVQIDPTNFPQNSQGNPLPGQFTYGTILSCVSSWTCTIDLNTINGWEEGNVVYIATYSSVRDQYLNEEGSWAGDQLFPGNSWATYFYCEPPPLGCSQPFLDPRDGHEYSVVQIGDQCWMAENLNYNSGTNWCYNNSQGDCDIYGRLYDWYTAVYICPAGWHLPSDNEWTIFETYLINNGYGWEGSGNDIAKSIASDNGWWSASSEGKVGWQQLLNNSSGFTALPAGHRSISGVYFYKGAEANFWSSTQTGCMHAFIRRTSFNATSLYRENPNRTNGFSVRCVKD